MPRTTVLTEAPPQPTVEELDGIISQLRASWTSRLTVRRQSKDDVGIRDIYVSLDDERIAVLFAGQEVSREITPGPHRLRVHNTLFWKTIDFEVKVGEHASFMVVNRRGFGTFSVFAYLIGANILYLTVEKESLPGGRP
ncbi:MAG: hypothetical protein AB7H96_23185 [Vicinamibacterales bacterium]